MKKTDKTTKKRRSEIKHPGLKKHYNSRIRQEYIDQDYIQDLNDEEKNFLSKFNEEYYGANLDFEKLENNLHNTEELKKLCTDRNNAQNRCIYGIAKAGNKISDINMHTIEDEAINIDLKLNDEIHSDPNLEDILIEYIDSKSE